MAEVRFTREALDDIAALHDWLAERSPAAAARIVAAIERTAGLLADNPALGRPQAHGFGRILIVPRHGHVISYRVEGELVEIVYVLHPSRARPQE